MILIKGCVAAVLARTHHGTNDMLLKCLQGVYIAKNLERHLKSIFLDFWQQTGPFPGSTPGYAVAQGVGGGPVAIPMQAPGVTGQTQPFYGYPQAGQATIGGPVPFQAVGNQPQLVVVPFPGGGFPPQYTEHSQQVPQKEPI